MDLPDGLKTTLDGQDFLILDETIPNKETKIWGFASSQGLKTMKKSSYWYVDGTIEIVESTLFKQVSRLLICFQNYIIVIFFLRCTLLSAPLRREKRVFLVPSSVCPPRTTRGTR